jgi:hypothetical protein
VIDVEARLREILELAETVSDEAATAHEEVIEASGRLVKAIDSLLMDVVRSKVSA